MIYDMAGNLVRKLPARTLEGTVHGIRGKTNIIDEWDGTNGRGRYISRGAYVIKLFIRYLEEDKSEIFYYNMGVQ